MADETPAPRKRRPRAELRELMVQAGVEVLAEHGVEVQISSVSYARVFEHLERTRGVRVTYGSVHERIWDSLQDYQLSVIERAGLWDPTRTKPFPALYAVDGTGPDDGDAADRPPSAGEAWQRFARDLAASTARAEAWREWLQTIVAMSTQPEGTVVRAAAREGARASFEHLEQMARDALPGADDPGDDPHEAIPDDLDADAVLARVSVALSHGLDLRTALTDEPEAPLRLRTGPDGELEDWTLHGLAMWAVARALQATSPDEAEEPPAD